MSWTDIVWYGSLLLCGFQLGWLAGKSGERQWVDRHAQLRGRYYEVSEKLASAENTIRQLRRNKALLQK